MEKWEEKTGCKSNGEKSSEWKDSEGNGGERSGRAWKDSETFRIEKTQKETVKEASEPIPYGCYECGVTGGQLREEGEERPDSPTTDLQGNGYPRE